ncbi:MAG: acetyltransferase [Proteobacteria bacterium]|nr:acetyltransferase [Pseudomonadota bacterium]MBU1688678.1 acetyltransferase [Pseudomonadota bacterium]
MSKIAPTAVVYPGVRLGADVIVEDFCVIGAPFSGQTDEETVIGDHAVIRSHTVIYGGCHIGNYFQTGNKANIRELNLIGDHVSIGTMAVLEHHIVIEDGVRIHSQAFIPEFSRLNKGCWIGPNVALTNARYPCSPDVKKNLTGPVIEESAKIGANVTILPGVVVGKNALIGAGSVVVNDVPSFHVVAGNPARYLRKIHY